MSVVGEERKRTILEKVEFKGKVKVSELAREFAVSTETIRRYLEELDREKKLKKVYGGAVQLPGAGIEAPMLEREMLHIEEKKRIGYKAATFVEDGDVIAIDDGSTPLQMVPYLVHRKNLTIVTSSFPVATQLISSINKKMFHGEVLFIGGKVSPKHSRVSGSISQQVIQQFHFHKAFVSIDGLLPSFGVSSFELEKAKLSEAMMKLAEKTYILCDHTKVGVKGNYRIAAFSRIQHVICDKKCPIVLKRKLKSIIFNGQFVKYIELPPDFKVGVLLLANRGIKDLYVCKKVDTFSHLFHIIYQYKKSWSKERRKVCQNGYIINLYCMQIFCKKLVLLMKKKKVKFCIR